MSQVAWVSWRWDLLSRPLAAPLAAPLDQAPGTPLTHVMLISDMNEFTKVMFDLRTAM